MNGTPQPNFQQGDFLDFDQFSTLNLLGKEASRLESHIRAQALWRRALAVVKMNLFVGIIQDEIVVQPESRRERILRIFKKVILNYMSDIILPLTVIYYAIIVPYRAAYNVFSHRWTIWDLTFDIIHILVAVARFLIQQREFRKSDEYIVFGRNYHILRDYRFYRLVLTIVISLPYQLTNKNLLIIKVAHIIDLGTLTSLTATAAGSLIASEFLFKLSLWWYPTQIILLLLIILHICACLWIWLSDSGIDPDRWLYHWDPGHSITSVDIYIQALMFMTETISTAGYGDSCAISPSEYFVVMFLQIVSGYFYTQFTSLGKYITEKIDASEMVIRQKNEEIIGWLLQRERANQSNLYSNRLSGQLEQFLVEEKDKGKKDLFEGNEFYEKLPFKYKFLLVIWYCEEEFLLFDDFFSDLSAEFAMDTLLEMIPRNIKIGEDLFFSSDASDGVFFILEGSVVEYSPNKKKIYGQHEKGSIIGLKEFFLNKRPSKIFRATENVKAAYIPRKKFNKISWLHRGDRKILRKKTFQKMKEELEDDDKSGDFAERELAFTLPRVSRLERRKTMVGLSPEQIMRISTRTPSQTIILHPSTQRDSSIPSLKHARSSIGLNNKQNKRQVVPLAMTKDRSSVTSSSELKSEIPTFDLSSSRNLLNEQHFNLESPLSKRSNSRDSSLIKKSDQMKSQSEFSIYSTMDCSSLTRSSKMKRSKVFPITYDSLEQIPSTYTQIHLSLKKIHNAEHDEKIAEEDEEHDNEEEPEGIMKIIDQDDEAEFHPKFVKNEDEGSEEDNLNSSLEVPTEGVIADDLIVDEGIFTLEQICMNLQTHFAITSKRLQASKDELNQELKKLAKISKNLTGKVKVKEVIAKNQGFMNSLASQLEALV